MKTFLNTIPEVVSVSAGCFLLGWQATSGGSMILTLLMLLCFTDALFVWFSK